MIDRALRSGLPARVCVIGEISGFRERTHWYFDLKDAGAVVGCVMFASAARRAGFVPENGQEVVASGRVEFYAKQGRASLLVDRIQPVGAGALELAFRALCDQLRARGWFDPALKRPVPTFPRRVAVVTSRTGAALQDVLATMGRRCPAVGVLVVDVLVQGERAADQIARAIDLLGRWRADLQIDAVLVTRGGGSREDLWAFNEPEVARAIHECPLPVVAAIGHETDTTIAELVADVRCATPTQAAVRLTPDAGALGEQLDALGRRMGSMVRRRVEHESVRLGSAARHPILVDPRSIIERARQRVDNLGRRLGESAWRRVHVGARTIGDLSARLERHRPAAEHARRSAWLERAAALLEASVRARLSRIGLGDPARRLSRAAGVLLRERGAELDALERELEAIGPVGVLRRGYSYTRDENGAILRSIAGAAPGQRIETRLVDGSIWSVVSDGSRAALPGPADPPKRRRGRRSGRPGPDQMDLFGAGG